MFVQGLQQSKDFVRFKQVEIDKLLLASCSYESVYNS